MKSIYLDYAATTPVDPRVASVMIPYLTEKFGNPASRSHAFGWEADAAVELAREQVAALVNADPKEIVWTSGATESNNLAIKGAAHFYQGKGKHVITMSTEHKAVLDTVRELEREGFSATYLDPEPSGLLDLEKFNKEYKAPTNQQALARDIYDAQLAGVRSTPTIFVNGRLLKERNIKDLERLIGQEMGKRNKGGPQR